MAARIKYFKKALDPHLLFIEPFELVLTKEMRNAARMALRDVRYEIGPFIALVDAATFDFSWQERKTQILNHIIDADLILLNRTDLTESVQTKAIGKTLAEYVGTEPLYASFKLGVGLKEVIAMVS